MAGGGESGRRDENTSTNSVDNSTTDVNQTTAESMLENVIDPKDLGKYTFWHQDDDTGEYYLTDTDIYLNSESVWSTVTESDYLTTDIDYTRGVWGAPYQFLPSADMRVDGSVSDDSSSISQFGIEYGERIASRMPILLLTPGRPFFMGQFDEQTKNGLLQAIESTAQNIKESVSEIINGNRTGGKYYTLRFAYAEYYKYVNTMANAMAVLLGIADCSMDEFGVSGGKIGLYDWSNFTNDKLSGSFNSKEFVAFYLDSETSISDSFSNSTSESIIASAANQVSDVGREIGFLLGTEGSKIDKIIDTSVIDDGITGISTSLQGVPIVGQLLQDISSKLVTVMTGGKLLFPEIWNDSSFSRNYSVNLKLRSPEPDVLSWYINIGVPICHLLAFVLPMQTSGATNQGYKSPFLVRGFYKGLFNVDMGIIGDMQFSKGSESSWTLNGLPMEVDVSMSIKELYNAMSMTNNNGIGDESSTIMDNEALLNYLMNLCGINIAEPVLSRYAKLYANAYANKITDVPGNIINTLDEGVSEFVHNVGSLQFLRR